MGERVKAEAAVVVRIPGPLREYASLTKDVVVIGSMNRIEIWDPDTFESYLNEEEADYETLAERVMVV